VKALLSLLPHPTTVFVATFIIIIIIPIINMSSSVISATGSLTSAVVLTNL
jgi:hypothetical protein